MNGYARQVAFLDWELPKENRLSNCLMLKENLSQGQSNRSFRIYGYLPNYRKKKILLFEGRTVGHKVYCRFVRFVAQNLRWRSRILTDHTN